MSRRLMKARREGKLYEELVAIEREGQRAFRQKPNGAKNGRKPKAK